LHHMDRGYDDLEGKLKGLGAKIQRVQVVSEDEAKEQSIAIQPSLVSH